MSKQVRFGNNQGFRVAVYEIEGWSGPTKVARMGRADSGIFGHSVEVSESEIAHIEFGEAIEGDFQPANIDGARGWEFVQAE